MNIKTPKNIENKIVNLYASGNSSIFKAKNYWGIGLTGNKFIISEFRNFILSEIGRKANIKSYRNSFSVKYGGLLLPQKIIKVLYEDSNIYLNRKKDLANKLININVLCRKDKKYLYKHDTSFRVATT